MTKAKSKKIVRGYGWRPDMPDHRDYMFSHPILEVPENLPSSVDLTTSMPPVYDQGDLGSCTANAIAAAIEFDLGKEGKVEFMPSRLFIYYNERAEEGNIKTDSGATIRDGVKSIVKYGDCPETLCPYIVSKFAKKPSAAAYKAALKDRALLYSRIIGLAQMKACLASNYPFVFGISCYESIESADVDKTGDIPMPRKDEAMVGGHAMVCCGYRADKQLFLIRNSWGSSWGNKGYGTIPYAYLTNTNLADDMWLIKTVS